MQPGVNLPVAIRVNASGNAPPGFALPARMTTGARFFSQAGAALRGLIGANVRASAASGIGLLASGIAGIFRVIGELFVPRPGAGKRRGFPSYIPQPAYDAKPNKPFQPIWDRVRQREADERRKAEEAAARAPAPLPPAEIFGSNTLTVTPALPTFAQYTPADPLGIVQRMTDAQDMTDIADGSKDLGDISDAIDILKALGLVR